MRPHRDATRSGQQAPPPAPESVGGAPARLPPHGAVCVCWIRARPWPAGGPARSLPVEGTVDQAVLVFLATGVSGAGKSTVARRLAAWGLRAISLDADNRLCSWMDVHGHRVVRPEQPDTHWSAAHRWMWAPARLDEIISDARDDGVETLWLCGHAANGHELVDRFNACFLQEVDQAKMRHRMTAGCWSRQRLRSRRRLVDRSVAKTEPAVRFHRTVSIVHCGQSEGGLDTITKCGPDPVFSRRGHDRPFSCHRG
jgi:hypothetical protein